MKQCPKKGQLASLSPCFGYAEKYNNNKVRDLKLLKLSSGNHYDDKLVRRSRHDRHVLGERRPSVEECNFHSSNSKADRNGLKKVQK